VHSVQVKFSFETGKNAGGACAPMSPCMAAWVWALNNCNLNIFHHAAFYRIGMTPASTAVKIFSQGDFCCNKS
jgi:hypothetical protein